MRVTGMRTGAAAVACALALVGAPAAAETVVTAVDRDTTWTAAGGPYVLEGEVDVAPAATLSIEPGTRVEGLPGSSLSVRGVLLARGTRTQRITFTSQSGDRDWHGLRFVGTATMHTADSRSQVASAVLSNASTAVASTYDSPRLSDLVFRANAAAIRLVMPAADTTITGSRFLHNGRAISGRTTSVVTITGSDFWANRRTLIAGPKRAYDCGVADDGAWILSGNDLLRGPQQRWHSGDIAATTGSGNAGLKIDARNNYWGTTSNDDVEGRIRERGELYWGSAGAGATRKEILVDPLSPTALTPWTPPGPVGTPAEEPSTHGDPATWSRISRPAQGTCHDRADLRAIRGEAGEALGKLLFVQAAVKRRLDTGCSWLVSRDGTFERGRCDTPVWMPVDGLHTWQLPLTASLPTGRYVAMSRTNHGGGDNLGVERVEFSITR